MSRGPVRTARGWLRNWLAPDFTLTKRHIGVVLIAISAIILLRIVIGEALDPALRGMGPMQIMSMVVAGVCLLVGLSLLPLGDQPA